MPRQMTLRTRIRIGMAVGAALFILLLLFLARAALVPFFIGGILAYLLAPLVESISQGMPFHGRHEGLARGLSILLIYALIAVILTLFGLLALPPIAHEVGQFIQDVPTYFESARRQIDIWSHVYEDLPPGVKQQVDDIARRIGTMAGQVAQEAVQRTLSFVTQTFSILLGFFAVPFWLFYVLKDQHRGTHWFYSAFPEQIREDVRAIVAIINHVLGSYVRAQLTLALFVGSVTTLGLTLMGVPFAFVLGVFAGITELIPILGPIIATIIAVIVTLATEPGMAPWVLLFFFAVQQLESVFLVPRVQGHAVDIHPAIIIILLVVAGQLLGIWGMLIAVPTAAVVRDIFAYIYRRLEEEPPLQVIAELEKGQTAADRARLTRTVRRSIRRERAVQRKRRRLRSPAPPP